MIETTTLFCGHSSRYVYTDDDLGGPGTQFCLLCVLDAERARNEKLAAENARLWERSAKLVAEVEGLKGLLNSAQGLIMSSLGNLHKASTMMQERLKGGADS